MRELAGDNFATALKHGDAQAGTGEAGGRDAAAVTGADNNDVVGVSRVTERFGETVWDGELPYALRAVGALRA